MNKRHKARSLRSFVQISIAVAIILGAVLFEYIFVGNTSTLLANLEEQHLEELSDSIRGTVETTIKNLRRGTEICSSRDSTYDFALGENNGYIDENFSDEKLLRLNDVDYVFITGKNGDILYAGAEPLFPDGLEQMIAETAAEVMAKAGSGDSSGDTGFINLGENVYIACVLPIYNSAGTGEPAGTFSFLMNLSKERLMNLTGLEINNFSFTDVENGYSGPNFTCVASDSKTMLSSVLIERDNTGRAAIFTFDHPRQMHMNGTSLIFSTTISLALSVIALMILLFLSLEYYMLRPMDKLISDVANVRHGEPLNPEKYSRYREFHAFSQTLNDTLSMLEQSITAAKESSDSTNILKSILNGMDAYLYVSDPDTDEILFINDKMKEHFEIPGDGVGDICWKVLQDGFETRCDFCPCYKLERDPSGTVVWEEHNTVTERYYRNTDRLIEWLDGQMVHLQHSVDITDIKIAEIALKERLDQQALITAVSQNFIMNDDIDVLIGAALEMTGVFMGAETLALCEYIPAADSLRRVCEWQASKTSPGASSGEMIKLESHDASAFKDLLTGGLKHAGSGTLYESYFLKDGNAWASPVFVDGGFWGALIFGDPADRVMRTQGDTDLARLVASVLSGVISRRGMEGQLRLLSSIVESSPQYISCISPDGSFSYINPAASDITGYSTDEIINGGLTLTYSDDDIRRINEEIIPEILENGKKSFELRLKRKDGEERIMAFSGFRTGIYGDELGGIASDITEMRKLESELIASKELAEEGSRAKSEFLSRMSHEMRTPMNAIIGMTNIARGSGDPDKKEYCLEKIDNASRHLLGVINDILDMSKIEANKFELSCSDFIFDKMVMNVINVVNFRMEEKHQRFSLYIDPSMPSVIIGDEQRLAQVITNLLTNAVKFTPEEGCVSLLVHVLEKNGDELTLQIEVVDDGIGVSPEQQKKLFRTFEQADGSIARKFGGTGLGLAISKRIINLMGGDVWIESELGSGSKFAFTMKAVIGSETEKADSIRKNIIKSDLNVLAVDDSPETLDYFSHVMQELGIPCDIAENGTKALEKVEARLDKPFDMIFVDWQMPGMNGIEFAETLKNRGKNNSVIIMISVAEWSDIEREAKDAGISDFVPKPLFPSLIMDCVNKYLAPSEYIDEVEEKTEETHIYRGKVALLAEDVDVNREIVVTILEDTELEIDCAENGVQAVEMFAKNPERYNIIFMDVHMPEMDGLEATRRIRALDIPEASAVPIIAMTANVFREDIAACLGAGMNDHIGKPIDFDELFEKLDKYTPA